MTNAKELAEALGWHLVRAVHVDGPTGKVVGVDTHLGYESICCDDAFMRLVEAELKKRGLAKEYGRELELATDKNVMPEEYIFDLITAPAGVRRDAALRVLEDKP